MKVKESLTNTHRQAYGVFATIYNMDVKNLLIIML